jgi:hypothetical protein
MTKMIGWVLVGVVAVAGIGCAEIEESESAELELCEDGETEDCEPETSEADVPIEDLVNSTSFVDNWRVQR